MDCLYIKKKLNKCSNFIKSKHFYLKSNKILAFNNKRSSLTEKDFINLFMGFYRLLKKSIALEIEDKYKKQIDYLISRLNDQINKNLQ